MNVLHHCDTCGPEHHRELEQEYLDDVFENDAELVINIRTHVEGRPDFQGENHPSTKLTNEIVADIKRDTLTHSLQELRDKYGVNKNQVFSIRTGKTWKHVLPELTEQTSKVNHLSSDVIWSRKLTKDVVLEIIADIEEGVLRNGELATKYGVSPSRISDIKHGNTWKELTTKT